MISVTADKLPNMHSTEYRGIPVVIQWPKGSVRVGEHDDGTPFKTDMKADYGYVPDTVATGDEERLDVYIGPDKESDNVYVIQQLNKSDGELDEYKVMLGFDSLEAAEEMYEYHLGESPDKEMGDIEEVPFDYLFDRVGVDREETKEQEVDSTRSELDHDETKVADDDNDWGDMIPGAEESTDTPNSVPAPKEDEPWYHGRRGEHTFDPSRPAFFARERDGAGWYAHERGEDKAQPNIGEYRLNIRKPARLRDLMEVVDELGVTDKDIQQNSDYDGENTADFVYVPAVREALKARGFDGFIGWDALSNSDIQIAVPFNTAQIKQINMMRAAEEKLTLIDAFVKVYKHEFEYFERVAEEVSDQLVDVLQEAGIKAAVTFRAKKPRKLKAKLIKRNQTKQYKSFQDIYDDVVDLAGVRVALYLPADREAVGKIIEQQFTLMRQAKNFPEDKGPDDVIGYVATHYLVRLQPETLHKDEYQYADTNVELQVASVLMHAWAEVTHDLLYKPDKGALAPEEVAMIHDLNCIVQEGEATLEKLQMSVETRQHGDLRFELMAALAQRLAAQSKGRATRRITASDVKAATPKLPTPLPHVSYIKAKLALWKAHGKSL